MERKGVRPHSQARSEGWHTGIPNYAKVRYANVYPGVDLIHYGNQRQLEYDFVVNLGADQPLNGPVVLNCGGYIPTTSGYTQFA